MPFKDPAVGRAWAAEHRAKNREKFARQQAEWRAKNREKRNAWEREYRKLERVQSMRSDGKAKWRLVFKEAYVESVSRTIVWERDAGRCGICGLDADRSDWHLDHIIPLSRGGKHAYMNVQVSHPICNMKKGDRL